MMIVVTLLKSIIIIILWDFLDLSFHYCKFGNVHENLIFANFLRTCLVNSKFSPGPIQPCLYGHRRGKETGNNGFKKKRHFAIHLVKTKELISCTVTA